MELNITVPENKSKSRVIQVSDELFNQEFNQPLIHQVVTAYLAKARAGTAAQKTRAEVRGGGKKPWKQKGTGRARAGTIRSPLWRGGGIIFAAKPRDYSQKVNKKMYKLAMRSILSELVRSGRLIVVDSFQVDEPKTKKFLEKIKKFNIDNALIITDDLNENLYLSSRNVPNIEIRDAKKIDPVCLVRFENTIITEAALKHLEKLWG